MKSVLKIIVFTLVILGTSRVLIYMGANDDMGTILFAFIICTMAVVFLEKTLRTLYSTK